MREPSSLYSVVMADHEVPRGLPLVAGLTGTHRFLAIDGRTSSTYESVYCDSPSLDSFRAQSSSSC